MGPKNAVKNKISVYAITSVLVFGPTKPFFGNFSNWRNSVDGSLQVDIENGISQTVIHLNQINAFLSKFLSAPE